MVMLESLVYNGYLHRNLESPYWLFPCGRATANKWPRWQSFAKANHAKSIIRWIGPYSLLTALLCLYVSVSLMLASLLLVGALS